MCRSRKSCFGVARLLAEQVQFWPGDDRSIAVEAHLAGNGFCSQRVISGDHNDPDTSLLAGRNRIPDFQPRRILKTDSTDKGQLSFNHLLRQIRYWQCALQRTPAPADHPSKAATHAPELFLGQYPLLVQLILPSWPGCIARELFPEHPSPQPRVAIFWGDGGHALAIIIKGEFAEKRNFRIFDFMICAIPLRP